MTPWLLMYWMTLGVVYFVWMVSIITTIMARRVKEREQREAAQREQDLDWDWYINLRVGDQFRIAYAGPDVMTICKVGNEVRAEFDKGNGGWGIDLAPYHRKHVVMVDKGGPW